MLLQHVITGPARQHGGVRATYRMLVISPRTAGCCRLSRAGGCVQLQQQLIAAKNLCLCKSFVAVDLDHGNPGGHLPCT